MPDAKWSHLLNRNGTILVSMAFSEASSFTTMFNTRKAEIKKEKKRIILITGIDCKLISLMFMQHVHFFQEL